MEIVNSWLNSRKPASIKGEKFIPKSHPRYKNLVYKEEGTQGITYHIIKTSNKRELILKKFYDKKEPDYKYLVSIKKILPNNIYFRSGTKRVILSSKDLRWGEDTYSSYELGKWLEKCILMPKVRGKSWKIIADEIRKGKLELSLEKRLNFAIALSKAIYLLEDKGCAHRDLCNSNLFLDLQENIIYLVDWDSMFHNSLYFMKVLPPGTEGYMAPWINVDGVWDSRKSWHKYADRFALSILIAELFLLDESSSSFYEGSLFSQEMFKKDSDNLKQPILQVIERLKRINEDIGFLFEKTLKAISFEECPRPLNWVDTLKNIELPREIISKKKSEEKEVKEEEKVKEEEEVKEEEKVKEQRAKKKEKKVKEEKKNTKEEEIIEEELHPNYFLLLLGVIIIPLIFFILYEIKIGERGIFGRFWRNSKTEAKIPVNIVKDTKNSSPQLIPKRYLIKIKYSDDDLKMSIDNQYITLNKDYSTYINIKPGIHEISLTFTGIINDKKHGIVKRTSPVTKTKKVKFEEETYIVIQIDREAKEWRIIEKAIK